MKNIEKALFLDIDGVLNSQEYIHHTKARNLDSEDDYFYYDIDPEKVQLLNIIIEKTKCTIVLSSAWRYYGLEEVNNALVRSGLCEPILYTTTLDYMDRGLQIKKFIDEHDVEKYVVLDDEIVDIKKHIPIEKIVRTSFSKGMQQYHCELVCEMFDKPLSYEEFIDSQIKLGYILKDFTPVKCYCGSKNLIEYDHISDSHTLVYYCVKCKDCGKRLGVWAYGYWEV